MRLYCPVCASSQREPIDEALQAGVSLSLIGQQYGLRTQDLRGHAAPSTAQREEEVRENKASKYR